MKCNHENPAKTKIIIHCRQNPYVLIMLNANQEECFRGTVFRNIWWTMSLANQFLLHLLNKRLYKIIYFWHYHSIDNCLLFFNCKFSNRTISVFLSCKTNKLIMLKLHFEIFQNISYYHLRINVCVGIRKVSPRYGIRPNPL
jgi:hypothetical protein